MSDLRFLHKNKAEAAPQHHNPITEESLHVCLDLGVTPETIEMCVDNRKCNTNALFSSFDVATDHMDPELSTEERIFFGCVTQLQLLSSSRRFIAGYRWL